MSTVTHTTYSETQTVSAASLNTIQGSLESSSGSIDNNNIRKESLHCDAVDYATMPVRHWATVQSHKNSQLSSTVVQTISNTTITNVVSATGKICRILLPSGFAVSKGEIVRITFHWEVYNVTHDAAVENRLLKFIVRTEWGGGTVIDNPYDYGRCHIGSFKKYDAGKTAAQGNRRTASWDGIFTVPSTAVLLHVTLMIQNDNGTGGDFDSKIGDGSMTLQVYNR